jgi:DNA repair protein RadC
MSIHDGHRQRLKDRFAQEGLDGFEPHQVLELLLFYCVPRKDTNLIAHKLLDKFKTVEEVLTATPAELKKVTGVGENTANFIALLQALERYRQDHQTNRPVILNTVEQCGRYLVPKFHNRRNEMVFLLCLDAKCKVICCKEVGEGSVNSASIPVRRLVEMALAANATSVVLAHNHPSGLAIPSEEDICTTRRIGFALNSVEIQLVDHIIVADGDFVSMAQSGLYRAEDCQISV